MNGPNEIDITETVRNSPLLARLVEEVRLDQRAGANAYNRMHNRHNRSITRRSPVRLPLPDPKPEEPAPKPEEPAAP